MHKKYSDLSVDYYVVMPNHVHLLLSKNGRFGREDPAPTVGNNVFVGGREDPAPTVGNNVSVGGREDPAPTNIIDAVAWFKFITTKKINELNGEQRQVIWQRSFYDHIIRNDEDYYESARYIEENPLRWERDELYLK
jgi:REP element-mobilizing transposase RayT